MRQELETAEGRMEAALFSSLARPGTAALRVEGPATRLRVGDPFIADAEPESPEGGRVGEPVFARATSDEEAISAVAVEQVEELPGGRRRLERVALYEAHPAAAPVAEQLVERLQRVEAAGYERLLAEQRRTWSGRWEDADVIVEGDPELQLGIRLSLYHLMASVADEGEAVVGARGLSGPAYRGHVFWDADVHVLPFLAATHPTAGRAMLEYRIRRLDAARRAARAGGYRGARFPWESARSGADVTPRTGRDPTGESVEIKTGLEEEHITADVAWAACCYADWTGDRAFIAGPGRDLLVETARYWASRARVDADGRAHIDKVIGPDEYHVDVDDNAFTNVMARWNLRRGAEAARAHGGAGDEEVADWHRVADALVDGYDPETGLYEQFAGFFALEPLVAADWLRRPVAAHLLLGSRRVESAQVLKQADVLMLHHLLPDEVVPGSLEPNLGFYEPRTAHASSLSPGMHASLLARAERLAEAVDWLRLAARIDLEDITQTTAGGVHLATMGSVWQGLVWGFAGARPAAGRLAVDPRLPDSWSALEVRVRYRGTRVRVRSERDSLALWAERELELLVGPERTPVAVGPAGVTLPRR
jgi:trehalose/maltose hydrolase-like predicted phosphorylase